MIPRKFRVGDHVRWNSEAGRVTGKIIRLHTKDADYKGHTHHASRDDPQYEIKSDKTDHIAMHKGSALRKVPGRRHSGAAAPRMPRSPVAAEVCMNSWRQHS
jgi:hypothetical protein